MQQAKKRKRNESNNGTKAIDRDSDHESSLLLLKSLRVTKMIQKANWNDSVGTPCISSCIWIPPIRARDMPSEEVRGKTRRDWPWCLKNQHRTARLVTLLHDAFDNVVSTSGRSRYSIENTTSRPKSTRIQSQTHASITLSQVANPTYVRYLL